MSCRTLLQRFITSKLTQACSTRRLLHSSCSSNTDTSFLRSPHSTRKIPILTFSTHTENKQVDEISQQEGYEELDILYQKILVEVTSHDPAVLKSYEYFATEAAKLLDIQSYSYQPPKVIERTTVLKSRHVYGKYHKVQYERRTHFKVIVLEKLTGSTADTYLEYIQRNLPEGVGMKVTKEQLEKFPVHIKKPDQGESAAC